MKENIGFYVHYHGLGHKHRTEAILRHLTVPATVLTSRIDDLRWRGPTLTSVRELACDIDDVPESGLRHAEDVPSFHYAPLWTDNITRRVAQYTAWLDQQKPDVMVVDVSAEISMLTRLASIPQIVMRQHGDRSDAAHLGAYAAARSLLAPFPQHMEDEITPDWVKEKTIYLDGFCRQADGDDAVKVVPNRVVVMFGRGGSCDVHQRLREAASSMPDHEWIVLGKSDDERRDRTPANLRFAGWIAAPQRYLASADVVISSAGHNSVMELGNLRSRFIAIAEQRPFDEQLRKTVVLQREQLAIGLPAWPQTHQWPNLIKQAKQLDPRRWDQVFIDDGAKQAAAHIEQVARWSRSHRQHASGEEECRLAS
ncbi:glycosyltransferase [Roseimaritima ulvae]|uniref:MurG-like transferase n=1 Tax=Roseimaritima ulvae TaxID=980254 RepID=A0A5B9QJL8_9BACT|nr:glycosyltransferase [Roseimaritima ulvae]QEG39248.1 MurG-like transferase [Roseimaritima ulvae]